SRIYEKPDLYYVQGVKLTLAAQRDRLTARQGQLQQEGKSLTEKEADDLATLNNLLTNLVQWTELKVVREQEPLARRLAIDKMAKAIYPHWHHGPEGDEAKELYVDSLDNEDRQIKRDLATVTQELQDAQQKKASLEKQVAPPEKTTEASPRDTSRINYVALQNQPASSAQPVPSPATDA